MTNNFVINIIKDRSRALDGFLSLIPGVYECFYKNKFSGGSNSARYCYSVWLRHLVMLHRNGLSTSPSSVVEMGPGGSFGVGLAALLTGSEHYIGVDLLEHAVSSRNLEVFDELVNMFHSREDIPGEQEFPRVKPYLESYLFPRHILTSERMEMVLSKGRVDSIRKSLMAGYAPWIEHVSPWSGSGSSRDQFADLIISQAVMEHLDDLGKAYRLFYAWLKPGGCMSHQIDFKCHRTSSEWNGHWTFPSWLWRLIRGRFPYLINRLPHSAHIDLLKKNNFRLVFDKTYTLPSRLIRRHLANEFKHLSNDDLMTAGAFMQSVKK